MGDRKRNKFRQGKQKSLRQWLIGDFSVKRLVSSFLLLYACLILYGIFFTDGMIFRPSPSAYADTADIIKLTVKNGRRISARYFPNPTATYTLLYSHGNAGDLADYLETYQKLQKMGFAVFAYDYQGYGTSEGSASESNTYQDIDAAYDYVTTKLNVPPQRIIAYGHSVGGGPTIDLASRRPVAAVVVQGTFITAFRVRTVVPIVPVDKFDNLGKIKKIRHPVLIIHGVEDEVIPFWHGQALFKACLLYTSPSPRD